MHFKFSMFLKISAMSIRKIPGLAKITYNINWNELNIINVFKYKKKTNSNHLDLYLNVLNVFKYHV